MKIIDLLNRIATKEELPKRIRYNRLEWKKGNAENEEKDYLNNKGTELFNQYLERSLIESLNDKVEILEDEETDIQDIEELELYDTRAEYDEADIHENREKINEIIRVVNKMQKESKE